MSYLAFFFAIFCAISSNWAQDSSPFLYGTFPADFKWSVATSAYQIEGGYKDGCKKLSIWDDFCHKGHCGKNDTGDLACDSYHQYQRDVEMVKELNLSNYRFSLSWSRILPTNDPNQPCEDGVKYYQSLIDSLIDKGIEPQVTLYHWDLPLMLETDYNGWLNDSSVDWFATYARFCFKTFDKVKFWITFNEPWVVSWLGYGNGVDAPGQSDNPGVKPYQVAHNLIKSHAEAYHIYKDELKLTGKVGITMNSDFYKENTTADVDATRRAQIFQLGWFANPIFGKDGDYPSEMKTLIQKKSEENGLKTSRLPEFTKDEINRIKRTYDFFGLNHYSTQLVSDHTNVNSSSYELDSDAHTFQSSDWEGSGSTWLKVVPWGIRGIVNWISNEYGNNTEIYITENGVSDNNGTLDDPWRTEYYKGYINELLKAITIDKVNVKGYTAWALMDNMEWQVGYQEKFGLFKVDFTDSNRTRTMKKSGEFYRQVVTDNGFPVLQTTSGSPNTVPHSSPNTVPGSSPNTVPDSSPMTTSSSQSLAKTAIFGQLLIVLMFFGWL